jgi:serine/threonine protein kinase
MKNLNENFSNYLDKRRQESIVSNISYLTTGTKTGHAKFTEDSPSGKPFKEFYVVGELLGEGGHSYIHRCIRKSTKLPYAVKHVQLSKLDKKARKSLKDELLHSDYSVEVHTSSDCLMCLKKRTTRILFLKR